MTKYKIRLSFTKDARRAPVWFSEKPGVVFGPRRDFYRRKET